jgi:putative ABC transport system ATP-binding protein
VAPILRIDQVGKKGDSDKWLFSRLSATVEKPTIIHILGKSGQGKSTLLRILGLLIPPDEGTVSLHGTASSQWTPEKWRMKVSYVAQQPVMLPGSVEDNLRIVSRLHQRPFESHYAQSLLERLGLAELDRNKPAAQLSGGEKQRLALARTLLLRPEVLLLDEVTASLDTVSKQATEQLLQEVHQQDGTTLIWITHDLEQARGVSKRVWFMAEGQLLEDAASEVFFPVPQTEEARRFLQASGTSS